MKPNELLIKWDMLCSNASIPVHQGYDATHPLPIYIGIDENNNRQFFLTSKIKPSAKAFSGRSIQVVSGKRADGLHTLVFKLMQPEQFEVFAHFCCDLAEYSRNADTPKDSLYQLVNRYVLWQRLLEKSTIGVLSENELKGLWGELLFLRDWLMPHYGKDTALSGWMGPEGSDQDFIYENTWFEVKTTSYGVQSLTISSLEQLDCDGIGNLVWQQAEKSSPLDAAALSVPQMIDSIKAMLSIDIHSVQLFDKKLLLAGYLEKQEYNDYCFRPYPNRIYKVDSQFPRLRRSLIPNSIASAKYNLSIASICDFEIQLEAGCFA